MRDGQREVVASCCTLCASRGVRPGMTVAHARALLPGGAEACIEEHDASGDARVLEAVARWAMRFTPRVLVEEPDGVGLDLTGCHRVYPDEESLADEVIGSFRRLGLAVRLAIAPTHAAAWACARYARTRRTIVSQEELVGVVESLPVEALRPDAQASSLLESLGIGRIGEVMDLARASLASRFGHGFVLRLDQMLGRALEIPTPVRHERPLTVERMFAGPTKRAEAVAAGVRECLSLVCGQLASRESGARRLDVTLLRSDLEPLAIPLEISRASREERHLWSLLSPRVESAHLGFGVEGVTITARRVVRLPHEQAERWTANTARRGGRLDAEVGRVIDTLSSRLGRSRVVRLEARESHVPERAFSARSAGDGPAGAVDAAAPLSPRPTLLLDRPRPAQIMLMTPDGPLMTLRANGTQRRIATTIGPERIEPEWWADDGGAPARDYFTVQLNDGRWLWVYRELERGTWWVHGEWA